MSGRSEFPEVVVRVWDFEGDTMKVEMRMTSDMTAAFPPTISYRGDTYELVGVDPEVAGLSTHQAARVGLVYRKLPASRWDAIRGRVPRGTLVSEFYRQELMAVVRQAVDDMQIIGGSGLTTAVAESRIERACKEYARLLRESQGAGPCSTPG